MEDIPTDKFKCRLPMFSMIGIQLFSVRHDYASFDKNQNETKESSLGCFYLLLKDSQKVLNQII